MIKYLKIDFSKEKAWLVFIFSSIVLFLMSTFMLYLGNSSLANDIAVYGYYLLIVSIILHLTSFLMGKATFKIEVDFHLAKEYFKRNPGSGFVVSFIVIILTCFLFSRDPILTNNVTMYSFYLLVIGVLLQLFKSFKKADNNYDN